MHACMHAPHVFVYACARRHRHNVSAAGDNKCSAPDYNKNEACMNMPWPANISSLTHIRATRMGFRPRSPAENGTASFMRRAPLTFLPAGRHPTTVVYVQPQMGPVRRGCIVYLGTYARVQTFTFGTVHLPICSAFPTPQHHQIPPSPPPPPPPP